MITPHAQRERGKVIGVGIHIYITEKPFTNKWDVGMAKLFSKKYGNKGWHFNYMHYE